MMQQVRVLCNDSSLNRLLTLLLQDSGYDVTVKPTAPCPLVLDLDSAEPPHDKKHSAIIAVCREPDALDAHTAAKCRCILPRPFEFSELISAVEDAAENAGKHSIVTSRVKKTPALTLTEADRVLSCKDGEVTLTPTEAAIFVRLMQERPNVVTYEQISDLIGGCASNKIEVHICSLRRKIAQIYPLPLIKTVRGQGYRAE